MKKATKFNTILGIINIFFFVVIAMCVLLKTGVEGVVNKAKTFIGLGVDYFKGITTFWNGDFVKIAIFVVLAILIVITLVLMIMSIVKKQGQFWSPLSIPCLCAMAALVVRNPNVVLGVTSIGSDLVYGLRCLATTLALVGVLVYMIIAVVTITGKAKEEPSVEETPVVEESKEESAPVAEEAPVVEKVKEEKVEEVPPTPVVEEEPAPAPVKEEPKVEPKKVEKKEEPKVEEKPAPVRESKPVFIFDEDGNKIYPGRDFEDRLYEADPELLQMYSDLKNEMLSYRKVHTRVSKTNDAFRFEGKLIAKIIVAGKGLKVYFALDPLSVDSAIYHQRDASGKKKFVETPLEVKVKSGLSFRKCKQLIALAMEQVGTVKKTRYTPIDWTKPNAKEKVEA